jgi:hypothetical protein
LHAPAAALAKLIVYSSLAFFDANCLHIANLLFDTCFTSAAFLGVDRDRHTRHASDGSVDARIEIRYYFPEATAFAARADGEEVLLCTGP